MPHRRLVLILGFTLLFCISAIDIYISIIAKMAVDFLSRRQELQLTISYFFAGMAVAQIFSAVVSDLAGRKKTLLLSLFVYLIASFICIFVQSIDLFMLARLFQGAACGSVVVCVLSISRDLYSGDKLIRVISFITAVVSLTPVISPFFGYFITAILSWRYIFVFLVIASFLSITVIHFYLPNLQTTPKEKYQRGVSKILTNARYMIFSFLAALVYSGYFVYLYNAPIIYKNDFNFNEHLIAILIGINGISLFLGSLSASYLVKFFTYRKVCICAFALILTSSLALFVLNLKFIDYRLPVFIICILCNIFSVAMIVPILNSQALNSVKSCFGAAAGLLGTMRYGFVFVVGVVIATFSLNSISTVAIYFLLLSFIGIYLLAV